MSVLTKTQASRNFLKKNTFLGADLTSLQVSETSWNDAHDGKFVYWSHKTPGKSLQDIDNTKNVLLVIFNKKIILAIAYNIPMNEASMFTCFRRPKLICYINMLKFNFLINYLF